MPTRSRQVLIWSSSGLALILATVIAAAFYTTTRTQSSFDTIEVGQTEKSVIGILGRPSVTEYPSRPFTRYAVHGCETPCARRIWYENRLALDMEAWSISIGDNGTVLEKYHWLSP
ncbi:hypothetical protein [Nitrospirillum amazonense]|uniref:hypothetical protein n=1 Tax=Nitrospirillum amazonense TaxID=28077 RepID=UPI00119FC2AA|nr:hypothetical protein [Nitrospirillum amazonense]